MTVVLGPQHNADLIENVVYAQVADLMAFEAVRSLGSQILLSVVELGFGQVEATAVAHRLIDRAMQRLATDPRRHTDVERVLTGASVQ